MHSPDSETGIFIRITCDPIDENAADHSKMHGGWCAEGTDFITGETKLVNFVLHTKGSDMITGHGAGDERGLFAMAG